MIRKIRKHITFLACAFARRAWPLACRSSKSPSGPISVGLAIGISKRGLPPPGATTLVNVARALGMEMMLIPQAMVPAVQSMLQPADSDDDRPAFTSDVEDEEGS